MPYRKRALGENRAPNPIPVALACYKTNYQSISYIPCIKSIKYIFYCRHIYFVYCILLADTIYSILLYSICGQTIHGWKQLSPPPSQCLPLPGPVNINFLVLRPISNLVLLVWSLVQQSVLCNKNWFSNHLLFCLSLSLSLSVGRIIALYTVGQYYIPLTALYTVKTGLFSISVPQTVPLQIPDMLI